MYAKTPQTIVLARHIVERDAQSLADYCDRLRIAGQVELTVDLGGVISCDRRALSLLHAMAEGSTGMRVVVREAHWSQFLEALRDADFAEVETVAQQARDLIGPTVGRRPTGRERSSGSRRSRSLSGA